MRIGPMQWLEQRHQTYYAVLDVPRDLRDTLGKKRMVVSLLTRDLQLAQVRRFGAVEAFKAKFAEARGVTAPRDIVDTALEWRQVLAKLAKGDPGAVETWGGHTQPEFNRLRGEPMSPQEAAQLHADEEFGRLLEHTGETKGDAAATLLAEVAAGRATPLLHLVDAWLREGGRQGPYQERSARQFRSDLAMVSGWVEATGAPATIEGVTKQVAGAVIQAQLAADMHRKTLNRKISAASSYWDWLLKRGHIEVNPWRGQSVPKGLNRSPGERPFTTAEVARLLAHAPDQELDDAMRVAALTGARIEAIYRLTVSDCAGGWFVFPPQKREPAPRRVPIHTGLQEIVRRRCEAKGPGDFLFHEPGPLRPGRERSMVLSKRFGRYRQTAAVNVHDRAEGTRRSLVNFHSWRRTFVTLAEQAGQPPHVISAVVGHREGRAGMTLGRYSGGPSDEQLRAVVEAVRLPPTT